MKSTLFVCRERGRLNCDNTFPPSESPGQPSLEPQREVAGRKKYGNGRESRIGHDSLASELEELSKEPSSLIKRFCCRSEYEASDALGRD